MFIELTLVNNAGEHPITLNTDHIVSFSPTTYLGNTCVVDVHGANYVKEPYELVRAMIFNNQGKN